MNKILITGACGYLGARISEYLAQQGNRITALDFVFPDKNDKWTTLMDKVIVEDIRNESGIEKLVDQEFDVLIHLVSLDHRQSNDNLNFVSSINVMPIWILLEKFSKCGLKKFIYFSTFQVYGKVPFKNITEDLIPSPQNKYGLTHLISENICNYYNNNSEVNCINVRLSNSYGSPVFKDNNCWWLVINDLCRTAFREKKIRLLSDGSPQRDFIHISDVCRAIEVLINNDLKNIDTNTYHISSGNTYTILELAHIVQKVFQERYGNEIPVILPGNIVSDNPEKFSKNARYIVDNTKLKSLGFSVKTDLNIGINELFDYLERNNDK
jgi:UDP-glucose 4-epimerase